MPVYIAFYSYKGGVGRSMALANVGWALAARGKRVVLIDLDLEAPGLHACDELAPGEGAVSAGMVELAAAYAETGEVPPLADHHFSVDIESKRGRLTVVPAGRLDPAYHAAMPGLDWRCLHPELGSEPFVTGLRARIDAELRPHYVLIDARTGFSDVGGLSTHRLADQVVLVFNLTKPCVMGTVQAYDSMTQRDRPPHIVLVASPVPPAVAEAGSLIQRRLQAAVDLMPLGLRHRQTALRIDYDPNLALAEALAVRRPEDFPAAQRYTQLTAMLQRANPDDVEPVLERASKLQLEGRPKDAVTALSAFVAAHPEDTDAHLALGRMHLATGAPADALAMLRRVVRLDPQDADAHEVLGLAHAALGQSGAAVEALRRAETLGNTSPALYSALEAALRAEGDTEAALGAGRKAMQASIGVSRTPVSELDSTLSFEAQRTRFVAAMRQRPPYPEFDPERFWRLAYGSLTLSLSEKKRVIRDVEAMELEPERIREVFSSLENDLAGWREGYGDAADELQSLVASRGVGSEREDLLALLDGGPLDALLLMHAAAVGPGPDDLALLRRAVALDPAYAAVYRLLADALSRTSPQDSAAQREACDRYAQAVALRPEDHGTLNNWGIALGLLAMLAEGDERRALLREACERYAQAVVVKSDTHEVFYNWGIALDRLADLADGEESRALYREACDRYARAIAIKPDKHEALYNWGIALGRLGVLAEGDERRRLHSEACKRYGQAIAAKPDKHEALNNWGNALRRMADLTYGEERRALHREACERFAQAVAIKPDIHLALHNWGIALGELAAQADGDERRALYREACERYAQAVAIKPDSPEALDSWAVPLLHLFALTSDPTEARAFAVEAAAHARAANAIQPQCADYNLACALSRLGEFDEAETLLQGVIDRREGTVNGAGDDPDLAPLLTARPALRAALAALAALATP